jgi:hypothetical protein
MLELFQENPWVLIGVLALLIPILGVVFGSMGRVRQAEIEANLKHEMLERGMSAEEIKMVIEATPRRRGNKRRDCHPQRDVTPSPFYRCEKGTGLIMP